MFAGNQVRGRCVSLIGVKTCGVDGGTLISLGLGVVILCFDVCVVVIDCMIKLYRIIVPDVFICLFECC